MKRLCLLLAAVLVSALGSAPLPGTAAAADPSIGVLVSLRAMSAPGHETSLDREAALATLAAALERQTFGPRLEVLGGSVLQAGLLAEAGPSAEGEAGLRARAREAGARFVVLATLSELSGRTLLDLRAFTADPGDTAGSALERVVLEGTEPEALLREAGTRVRRVVQDAAQAPRDGLPVGQMAAGDDAPFAAPAGARVVELRIQGNARIGSDAIRAVIGSREGEPVDRARLAEDLKRIYELGFFRDVQIHASDVRGGVAVTFVVDENPLIRRVTLSGNDNVGSEEIKDALTITVGSTIDFPLLFENERRIEALYQAQGYYLAEVDARVEPLTDTTVGVDFEVDEGAKLRLEKIEFEGNESLSDEELLGDIASKPWTWTSHVTRFWDSSGLYAEPIFYQDLDSIQRKYMDNGYIRARIGEPEVSYDEDGIRVKVAVEEGPQFRVGQVEVVGDESMETEALTALVGLTEGAVFDRSRLSDDVEKLRSHYSDRGFFSAQVRPRTDVDPKEHTIDVVFEVEKGSLYFVDSVSVQGNTRTRDSVVRRELSLDEGDLFSNHELARSRSRVRRLGFFEEVSVEAKPSGDDEVDITIDVVERPTGSFSFGAGFGSGDGFLLNAALRQENLFGRGYAVSMQADLGTQSQLAYFHLSDPFFRGTPLSVGTTFSLREIDFNDFRSELLGMDLNLSYPLDEGETRLGSGYSWKSREVTETQFAAASLLQREELQGKTTTSLTSLSLLRDTRDDIRFPNRGQISGLALEWAGFGGVSSFLRLEARTTWWFPLRRFVGFDSTFVVNSRVGWALPFNSIGDFDLGGCTLTTGACTFGPERQLLANIDDDLKLPLAERYFLGGIGAFQVRGFRQRSLGPRRAIIQPNGDGTFSPVGASCAGATPDASCNSLRDRDIDDFERLDDTDVIGGNKMALLNFEVQFPISEELGLRGLVFFDMGNAFAEEESINPADFRFGTGLGALWFSPFGPILLQLGFPLDRLEDEDATVFEFSLGGSQF